MSSTGVPDVYADNPDPSMTDEPEPEAESDLERDRRVGNLAPEDKAYPYDSPRADLPLRARA